MSANGLTFKQEKFITQLLAQSSMAAAAKATGVSTKTGGRWIKLECVQIELTRAQREQYHKSLSILQRGVSVALDTLRRNMTGKDVPPSTQVRAAQVWLETSLVVERMNELESANEEIMRRLDQLGIQL